VRVSRSAAMIELRGRRPRRPKDGRRPAPSESLATARAIAVWNRAVPAPPFEVEMPLAIADSRTNPMFPTPLRGAHSGGGITSCWSVFCPMISTGTPSAFGLAGPIRLILKAESPRGTFKSLPRKQTNEDSVATPPGRQGPVLPRGGGFAIPVGSPHHRRRGPAIELDAGADRTPRGRGHGGDDDGLRRDDRRGVRRAHPEDRPREHGREPDSRAEGRPRPDPDPRVVEGGPQAEP